MLLGVLLACFCAPGAFARPSTARGLEHLIVFVRRGHSVALHDHPLGEVIARLRARTAFGSPRAFGVVRIRDERWLGVTVAGLGDHRLAWIDGGTSGLRFVRTRLEIDVNLSRRVLVVGRGRQVVRTMLVGVGRSGSPTPTGRYSITDKLPGPEFGSAYGCCILALSATQPRLPAGWIDGDRIAIHGAPSPGGFGQAVSAGCLHARNADLRYLMRVATLGTPVVIRP